MAKRLEVCFINKGGVTWAAGRYVPAPCLKRMLSMWRMGLVARHQSQTRQSSSRTDRALRVHRNHQMQAALAVGGVVPRDFVDVAGIAGRTVTTSRARCETDARG